MCSSFSEILHFLCSVFYLRVSVQSLHAILFQLLNLLIFSFVVVSFVVVNVCCRSTLFLLI